MASAFKLWFLFVLISITLKLLALPQLPENAHLYHVEVEVNMACGNLFQRESCNIIVIFGISLIVLLLPILVENFL